MMPATARCRSISCDVPAALRCVLAASSKSPRMSWWLRTLRSANASNNDSQIESDARPEKSCSISREFDISSNWVWELELVI